jgi:hypothetical protein
MPIHFQHAIDVPQSPEQAFAVLDDLALTPQWLERCVSLETLTPGPNHVGTKLKYAYREGSHTGLMDGEIIARTPNAHLLCLYQDKMMDVTVDFRVSKIDPGTRLIHTIEITPKTLMGRLFTPLIRMAIPKQTIKAMESLRTLLASRGL